MMELLELLRSSNDNSEDHEDDDGDVKMKKKIVRTTHSLLIGLTNADHVMF